MTKADLIAKMAEEAHLSTADAEGVFNVFFMVAEATLKAEGRLALTGFGSFVVEKRNARTGRNPRTGAPLNIPACNVVKFKPGKALKDSVK